MYSITSKLFTIEPAAIVTWAASVPRPLSGPRREAGVCLLHPGQSKRRGCPAFIRAKGYIHGLHMSTSMTTFVIWLLFGIVFVVSSEADRKWVFLFWFITTVSADFRLIKGYAGDCRAFFRPRLMVARCSKALYSALCCQLGLRPLSLGSYALGTAEFISAQLSHGSCFSFSISSFFP